MLKFQFKIVIFSSHFIQMKWSCMSFLIKLNQTLAGYYHCRHVDYKLELPWLYRSQLCESVILNPLL